MKLRRRIISAALSLVLALSLLPAAVFAEDATYTETVMLTTIASDGDVEFYDAYTSNADTEIIFAGGTSGTGVNTQSLDKGDGIVPASRTKYVHTDDSIDTKVVTGSYTYYLNYTDSAVKLERLNMSSVTFAVNSGTLTIGTSGSIDNVYVQGSDAVLNLTDNSKIYTYLYHSQGIVNLSGTVTITKLYYYGVPMTITDSIEGSSIKLSNWGISDYKTSGENYVLAAAADGYTLTSDDLSAFSVSATKKITDYSFYVEDNQIIYGKGHTHTYGTPEITWTVDEQTGEVSATASVTCTGLDDTKDLGDCTVTQTGTVAATCTKNSGTVYTASITYEGVDYTDTYIVYSTEDDATGHSYQAAYSWSEDYSSCTATITCAESDYEATTAECVISSTPVAATCTENSYTTYIATVTFPDGTTDTDEQIVTDENTATGHSYTAAFDWSEDYSSCTVTLTCESEDDEQTVTADVTSKTTDATCTTDGETMYTATITYNGIEYSEDKTVTIPATGHTESEAVVENEVAVTCTEAGSYDSVVYCAVCGAELSRETTTIPATGHNYEGSVVKTEPTCTENGSYVITVACTECDDELYTYTYAIPATGHSWDEGMETVAATRYTQGEVVYTCTVCGATKTEYTNKVNATFLFDDVLNDSQYYFIPVYWACDLGITDGTSATLFSPSQGCTRAQFVTFLYRLAQATGVDTSTEATSTAFTDVDSDDYFYEAVLWAAENGITDGTSDTTFTPNRTITRREAITMLYRYEYAANGEPSVNDDNPFDDVTTDDYAYTAILWAVEQDITSGTGETTFSPANTCTRAMMVTFLYRYAAIQD